MNNQPRIVVDTNIVISALLIPKSIPRQAFDKAFQEATILLSLPVLEELNDVLRRPKFNKYITEKERLAFLATFVHEATLVQIKQTVTVCRDPKDDKLLELAVNGEANYLITGDNDLLILHPFRDIAIVTPQVYLHQSSAKKE